jgi:chromosome segregation ATPase
MNEDVMIGLIAGFVAGLVLMALILFVLRRRLISGHQAEIQRYDESIVDLRQERAEDKETNRRLRHELAAQSPERLVETTRSAEMERDNAVSERDQALEQLQLVQADLSQANSRITDREAKLREYREALKEIRVALEAQDRSGRSVQAANGLIDTDTSELLAVPVAAEVAEAVVSEPKPADDDAVPSVDEAEPDTSAAVD